MGFVFSAIINLFSHANIVQSARIPAPILTEKNLPDQKGKVHIVTGGYAGVGEQLAQILYGRGAKVYIAGRNEGKATAAIARIKKQHPSATGELVFLNLDLSDLNTIKPAAEEFMSKETRLDVLVNNAGVMFPAKGSLSTQGHDLQFSTNCLSPYLFTKLLYPILKQTAATASPNSVRILWASSVGIQVLAPRGGIQLGGDGKPKDLNQYVNYAQTKVGNNLLAIQTQQVLKGSGIVSVSFNPGNLSTELQRHSPGGEIMKKMLYPAVYGAYTELWAGWSDDVTVDKGITYVMPWGRDGTQLVRPDIQESITKHGLVEKFWQYCEEETKQYV